MKTEHLIIALAILIGLVIWVADAILNTWIDHQDSFWELLLTDIPSHDVYLRALVLVCFFIFGIAISRIIVKCRRRVGKAVEQAQTARERTQQQQECLRSLEQATRGIAHELNNTLSPIVGYSDLLLNSPEVLENKERAITVLESIQSAAKDATDAVKRLRGLYVPHEEQSAPSH